MLHGVMLRDGNLSFECVLFAPKIDNLPLKRLILIFELLQIGLKLLSFFQQLVKLIPQTRDLSLRKLDARSNT